MPALGGAPTLIIKDGYLPRYSPDDCGSLTFSAHPALAQQEESYTSTRLPPEQLTGRRRDCL